MKRLCIVLCLISFVCTFAAKKSTKALSGKIYTKAGSGKVVAVSNKQLNKIYELVKKRVSKRAFINNMKMLTALSRKLAGVKDFELIWEQWKAMASYAMKRLVPPANIKEAEVKKQYRKLVKNKLYYVKIERPRNKRTRNIEKRVLTAVKKKPLYRLTETIDKYSVDPFNAVDKYLSITKLNELKKNKSVKVALTQMKKTRKRQKKGTIMTTADVGSYRYVLIDNGEKISYKDAYSSIYAKIAREKNMKNFNIMTSKWAADYDVTYM